MVAVHFDGKNSSHSADPTAVTADAAATSFSSPRTEKQRCSS
jgi:hypothetical protein